MHCYRQLIPLITFATLSHAVPPFPNPPMGPQHPMKKKWLLSDPVITSMATGPSPPAATDYRTMSPGKYTVTNSDGSVVVIIVATPTPSSTLTLPSSTSTSSTPLPTCPPECDCSDIADKQSEQYFQCITNPNCRFCKPVDPDSDRV